MIVHLSGKALVQRRNERNRRRYCVVVAAIVCCVRLNRDLPHPSPKGANGEELNWKKPNIHLPGRRNRTSAIEGVLQVADLSNPFGLWWRGVLQTSRSGEGRLSGVYLRLLLDDDGCCRSVKTIDWVVFEAVGLPAFRRSRSGSWITCPTVV